MLFEHVPRIQENFLLFVIDDSLKGTKFIIGLRGKEKLCRLQCWFALEVAQGGQETIHFNDRIPVVVLVFIIEKAMGLVGV